jgi:hypothetical protein
MGNPPPGAGGSATRAQKGETLPAVARRLFGDERVAGLLSSLNASLSAEGVLKEGVAVQLPGAAALHAWSREHGITVGMDPRKGGATRERRRWKGFQAVPNEVSEVLSVTPEHVLGSLVEVEAKGMPGAFTADVLRDAARCRDVVAKRVEWLGRDRVLSAAGKAPAGVLDTRATLTCGALGVPGATGPLVAAVHLLLADAFLHDVALHARQVLDRLRQVLRGSTQDPAGGPHLLAALATAPPGQAPLLLDRLGVPAALRDHLLSSLASVVAARKAIVAVAGKTGTERRALLSAGGLPADKLEAVLRDVDPRAAAAAADVMAVRALGLGPPLDDVMAVTRRCLDDVTAALSQLDPLPSFVLAAHAFSSLYVVSQRRGLTLGVSSFPVTGTPSCTLDVAMLAWAPPGGVVPPLEGALPAALALVDRFMPGLAEVDVTALGRGLPALLAHCGEPVVRSLRPADLRAAGARGAPAAVGPSNEVQRLAALSAALSVATRFPLLPTLNNAARRAQFRAILPGEFALAYAVPRATTGKGALPPPVEEVRQALRTLLDAATRETQVHADVAERVVRARALVDHPAFLAGLTKVVGPARYPVGGDDLSAAAKWLCVATWLVVHAKDLPPPDKAPAVVHQALLEVGGRVVEATRAALLQKLR